MSGAWLRSSWFAVQVLVAGVDALGRPPLAAAGRGLGVVLAVRRPVDGEAVVEDRRPE